MVGIEMLKYQLSEIIDKNYEFSIEIHRFQEFIASFL